MPKRDESTYSIVVPGEPQEVTEIRNKILTEFQGLEFVDEGHKYFLGNTELESVSSVVSKYEHEFDEVAQSIRYAEKHGETPEYWRDQWKFTNLKATVTGTQVHAYAESLAWMQIGHPENITPDNKYKYIEDKGWLIPTRHKEEAALKFWNEFPDNMHVVLPETRVYNVGNTIKYAGTFDLLVYYQNKTKPDKSGLMILDWKTNADIYKDYSRMNNKMMYPPFEKMYDEPFGGYTLQLTLYNMALEKIGLKVIGRRIVWLKDDGTFDIVPADYLKQEFLSIDNKLL